VSRGKLNNCVRALLDKGWVKATDPKEQQHQPRLRLPPPPQADSSPLAGERFKRGGERRGQGGRRLRRQVPDV
jgi:hypothetical protein